MGVLRNLFPSRTKEQVREDSEREILEFLARGGAVQIITSRRGPVRLTANGKTSGQVFANVYN